MSLADFRPSYITVTRDGDLAFVRFQRSHLTDELNTEQLGHELFSLVDQYDCRKVALDLSGVEYMTSSVLGKIITLHRKLHRKDGLLVVCQATDGVTTILRTSRLLDYFHVAPDAPSAAARLRSA